MTANAPRNAKRFAPTLFALLGLILFGSWAHAAALPPTALPQGGAFTRGAGSITQSGQVGTGATTAAPNSVAVVNWASGFNVGSASKEVFVNATGAPTLNVINL